MARGWRRGARVSFKQRPLLDVPGERAGGRDGRATAGETTGDDAGMLIENARRRHVSAVCSGDARWVLVIAIRSRARCNRRLQGREPQVPPKARCGDVDSGRGRLGSVPGWACIRVYDELQDYRDHVGVLYSLCRRSTQSRSTIYACPAAMQRFSRQRAEKAGQAVE